MTMHIQLIFNTHFIRILVRNICLPEEKLGFFSYLKFKNVFVLDSVLLKLPHRDLSNS